MYFMYNHPNDAQGNQYNQQPFQKQIEDPMKDIKKNYGDYLRQQIQQKEDKKREEKYGKIGSRQQDNQYQINDISNQQYAHINSENKPYERIKHNPNQESTNIKPQPDRFYGEFLKQQMEEKKKNNQNQNFKQSKIQELQEKMAAQQENPFGKGGSGAPLIGKNGEIISSRKPDMSQIQHDYQTNKQTQDQGNYVNYSQPNYKLNREQYPPQLNMHESLANKINDTSLFKNKPQPIGDFGSVDKRDFYRANVNLNMESSIPIGRGERQLENASINPNQSDNNTNFRRNNKRLLDRENQNESDIIKREKQKLDMNSALQEQIFLKDRKKQQEKEREREEELKMEERLRKEREQIEKSIKEEEEKKKKKIADVKQENDEASKGKKNKVIPYHLDEASPQKGGSQQSQKTIKQKQNIFDDNSQSKNLTTTNNNNNNIPNLTTNTNNANDFYSMPTNNLYSNNFYSTNQQNQANNLLNQVPQRSGYTNNPYNISPNIDIFSNTYHLQRMGLNSSESRNRDIIPEIDNMKQQIQDQYKNLQLDVHKAKLENIQAIDERNKFNSISRQQVNPYTIDYSDFSYNNPQSYGNQYALNQNNMYRQQYNKSRESSGYQSHRRQINSADHNQLNMLQMKQPTYQREEEYNIQSLDTESKMIPMDLIDHLRQKDKLTMSQLINYDQDYSQNSILNNQTNLNNDPNTLNNKWDIPTMNSDITKDIDKILSHQSHQIQQTAMMQQKEEEIIRQKYSSQSQHRNKIKSETAFNLAAKGILDSTNYNQFSNNRVPSSYENSQKRSNTGYQQNLNGDNQNFNSTNSFQKGYNQNYDDSYNQREQDLNMSELQQKLQKENDLGKVYNEEQDGDKRDNIHSRDQIFEYKRNNNQYDNGFQSDEDSDEIKKQKALREIKEKFHLSTVNEELNEKTRQLSTILETGKYQDNKDLYESLRNVEDPDFYKLDELIKQFKSAHLQSNNK